MTVQLDVETTIPNLPRAFREIGDELVELIAAEAELLITDTSNSQWPHPGDPRATHSTGLSIESFEGVAQGNYAELVNSQDYSATSNRVSGRLTAGTRAPPRRRSSRACRSSSRR